MSPHARIFALAVGWLAGVGSLEAGLLAYFSFDRDFSDTSGNFNHLTAEPGTNPTLTTAPALVAVGDGALDLDGNDWLNLSTTLAFGPNDPWSVAFWVRRDPNAATQDGMIVGEVGSSSNFIWTPDNPAVVQGLRFRNASGTSADFGGFPDDGAYHHWAVIAPGDGSVTVYRDNISLGSLTPAGGTTFTASDVGHAFSQAGQIHYGQIDELYLFDEAISPDKVAELSGLSTKPMPVRRVRVVLLGGQSNAAGRGTTSQLPIAPINLQEPQDDVDLYEGSSLTTLRPGSQFGPEITLGRSMADALAGEEGARVAILKYGVGGTSLAVDWKPGGDATTAGDGPLYVTFQQTVNDGLAALAAAYPGASIELTGMLWVQGERDAKGGHENQYKANLAAFIEDVRMTYGPQLPFVISRLAIEQTNIPQPPLDLVREAQTIVANDDPLSPLLDTDGFGMQSDNLHFDSIGLQKIGTTAAKTLLAFHPISPIRTKLEGRTLTLMLDAPLPGFRYTLQTSSTLALDDWTDGESVIADGTPLNFTAPSFGESSTRFIRLRRTPAP